MRPKCSECGDRTNEPATSRISDADQQRYLCADCAVCFVRAAPVRGLLLSIITMPIALIDATSEVAVTDLARGDDLNAEVAALSNEEIAERVYNRLRSTDPTEVDTQESGPVVVEGDTRETP